MVMLGCLLLAGFYGGRAWVSLIQHGDMNTVVMWSGKGNGTLILYTVRQRVGCAAFWLSVGREKPRDVFAITSRGAARSGGPAVCSA